MKDAILIGYGGLSFVDADGDSVVYVMKDGKLHSYTNNVFEGVVSSFTFDDATSTLRDNFGSMVVPIGEMEKVLMGLRALEAKGTPCEGLPK
mmetsp:Transcript_29051/g.51070  ORF Transcript_29051/g.51070 Transcript_29051/m.51070 type:complete len:92 (+) Transcript_29051:468-743(+)